MPVIHKGDLLHANGKIILKNDRPFPIRVEFTKSFFEVEHPVEKLNEIADAGTTPLITNSTSQQWNSNFVKKITETFSDKGLVIEPNGKVQIPLSEFFYLDKKTGNNFFSISFTLKYKLVPINPSDNQEIKNSSKDKTLISSNYFKYENRKISSDRNIICINIEKECEAASRNNLDVYARLESYNIDQRNSLTSFGGQYLIQGGQPSPFGGFNLALPNRLVTPYDGYTGQSSDNPQPAE